MAEGALPAPLRDRLVVRYGEAHRAYHTLAHVQHALALLDDVVGLTASERRLLEWAIWFHDAIYDPTRADNEERSAELAERELAGIGADAGEAAEVARLVRLTKSHVVADGDRLGALLISIDLAILGAEPGDYDAYADQIRREYGHVPDEAFRVGRAAVLRRFLEATRIFPHPHFAARFETSARENLARELQSLSS